MQFEKVRMNTRNKRKFGGKVMRYLLGILGSILFIGLAFGSIYFSVIDPNMNLLLLGIVVSVVLLIVFLTLKKRQNRF